MKSFLGKFYRHLAIFFWSHWLLTNTKTNRRNIFTLILSDDVWATLTLIKDDSLSSTILVTFLTPSSNVVSVTLAASTDVWSLSSRLRRSRMSCLTFSTSLTTTHFDAKLSLTSTSSRDCKAWNYLNIVHFCPFFSFFKKWANPGLFLLSFRSFQTSITIFTTN